MSLNFIRRNILLTKKTVWRRNIVNNKRYFTKQLTDTNISKSVLEAQYAVRGPIVIRALEIGQKLKEPNHGYPFDKLIMCNIGNPQELGQVPLTYHRQVLSGCLYPELLNKKVFSNDINDKIKNILTGAPCGTVGAYTHSQGYPYIREIVADFIYNRDGGTGDKINPMDIFLTDGASPGIKYVLQCLISNPKDGVLCPIPQYPLYSASISLLNGKKIDYYLNEDKQWGFEIDSAEESLKIAVKNGINPKGIVVINPGNPTGNCLQKSEIESIIELARKYDLTILADEVYQENIYNVDRPFISFNKVLNDMGSKYKDTELVSFHSTSKGILGECGLRGGYMHIKNIDKSGYEQLYKLVSVSLCSNTIGQIAMGLLCSKPKKGEESYDLFKKEYDTLYESLKRRATTVTTELNKIDGISCQPINGAMYAFPQITIPKKAVDDAKSKGTTPDALYCMSLLESAGICCVPGSGFGQKDGTFHLRTTLLPPEDAIQEVVNKVGVFHKAFTQKYS